MTTISTRFGDDFLIQFDWEIEKWTDELPSSINTEKLWKSVVVGTIASLAAAIPPRAIAPF